MKYARLQFFLQFHHETFALPVTFSHISGWEDGITAWNPFLQTSGRDDTGWSILQFYVSPRFGDIYLERSNTPPTKTATFFPPPASEGHEGQLLPHPFACATFFPPLSQTMLRVAENVGASPLLQAPKMASCYSQVVSFTSHDFGGQGIYEDLS